MTCTYEDIVSICDAHGIGLPVDCVEMVVTIVNLAAARTQGAHEPICNCKAEHWQPHAQYCPVTQYVRDQFRKSGENAQGADARPVAQTLVDESNGAWAAFEKSVHGDMSNKEDLWPVWQEAWEKALATRDAAPKEPFNVSVATLKASNGTTYVLVIDRADRPVSASPVDSTGRITPFESANREHVEIEAEVWRAFLNGDGDTRLATAMVKVGALTPVDGNSA